MTPALESAIDRLRAAVSQRGEDDDLIPFEESEPPPCREMHSPGGAWVLAPSVAARDEHLADHPGAAVFVHKEIRRVQHALRSLSSEERQAWLGDVIVVKSVFPDAEVVEIRERSRR